MNKKLIGYLFIICLLIGVVFQLVPTLKADLVTYNPSSLTVVTGTQLNGTLSDLAPKGNGWQIGNGWQGTGDVIAFAESTGAFPLDLRFNFTSIPSQLDNVTINIYQEYNGNPSHHIAVEAYNFATATWDQYGVIDYSASYYWIHASLSGNLTNYVRNGNFTVRLLHLQNGISGNRFYLATLFLSTNTQETPLFNNVAYSSNVAGSLCTFSAFTFENDTDNDMQSWIFGTNNTGTWVNDTMITFPSGSGGWMNVTKILDSLVGDVVAFQFYVNCSDGNTGITSLRTITVVATPLPTPTPIITPSPTPNPNVITPDEAAAVAIVFGVFGISLAIVFPVVYMKRKRSDED